MAAALSRELEAMKVEEDDESVLDLCISDDDDLPVPSSAADAAAIAAKKAAAAGVGYANVLTDLTAKEVDQVFPKRDYTLMDMLESYYSNKGLGSFRDAISILRQPFHTLGTTMTSIPADLERKLRALKTKHKKVIVELSNARKELEAAFQGHPLMKNLSVTSIAQLYRTMSDPEVFKRAVGTIKLHGVFEEVFIKLKRLGTYDEKDIKFMLQLRCFKDGYNQYHRCFDILSRIKTLTLKLLSFEEEFANLTRLAAQKNGEQIAKSLKFKPDGPEMEPLLELIEDNLKLKEALTCADRPSSRRKATSIRDVIVERVAKRKRR